MESGTFGGAADWGVAGLNLTQVDFTDAHLQNVTFEDVTLHQISFERAVFESVTFRRVTLMAGNLSRQPFAPLTLTN